MRRGRCGACGAMVALTKTGELFAHGPVGWRCPGSRCDPAPDLLIDPKTGRCLEESS